eukprot:10369124-Ditylum_brightwellii.AAC.1
MERGPPCVTPSLLMTRSSCPHKTNFSNVRRCWKQIFPPQPIDFCGILTTHSNNTLPQHAKEDFSYSYRTYSQAFVKDYQSSCYYSTVGSPSQPGVCQPSS